MKRQMAFDEPLKNAYQAFEQGSWQCGLDLLTGYDKPEHIWAKAGAYRELGYQSLSHFEAAEFYKKAWQSLQFCASADPEMFPRDAQSEWPTRSWAVQAYVALLGHKDYSVRAKACRCLMTIGPGANSAIDALREAAITQEPWKSFPDCANPPLVAIQAICHPTAPVKHDASTRLRDRLGDYEYVSRGGKQLINYAEGLEADSTLSESELVDRLDAEDESQRARAAAIIGGRANAGQQSLSHLFTLLGDRHRVVRGMALLALSEHYQRGNLDSTLEAALIDRSLKMLHDDDSFLIRKSAADTLAHIKRIDSPLRQTQLPKIVESLASALHDPDMRVRFKVMDALGALGPDARQTVGAIQACDLGDEEIGRWATIARIEQSSELAEEFRSKLIKRARWNSWRINRQLALQELRTIPMDKTVRERLFLEALFLDDDKHCCELAREVSISLLSHENAARLGVFEIQV